MLEVVVDALLVQLSIVYSVRVDAVPDTDQLRTAAILDHDLTFKLGQPFRVEKSERTIHIVIHHIL